MMDWNKLEKALTYTPRNFKKLTQQKADRIRVEYETGNYSMRQLGRKYGVEACSILRILRREYWNGTRSSK